jgi:plasmid stabilization system protein ParE
VRLAVAERAREDLARIWDFNIQRSEQWAERVQRRLIERALSLLIAPNSGRRLVGTDLRRLSVPDIRYVMDYPHDSEVVQIMRIRSTREVR